MYTVLSMFFLLYKASGQCQHHTSSVACLQSMVELQQSSITVAPSVVPERHNCTDYTQKLLCCITHHNFWRLLFRGILTIIPTCRFFLNVPWLFKACHHCQHHPGSVALPQPVVGLHQSASSSGPIILCSHSSTDTDSSTTLPRLHLLDYHSPRWLLLQCIDFLYMHLHHLS